MGQSDGAEADVFERVIEATRDAVVFIGADARISRFNAAASDMFGYSAREAIGQPVTLLMPEPYASEHAGYIERYEQTGTAQAIGRIRSVMGRRKNGERFPVELSVTEVGHGQVRYAAILRDISARARIEQQLALKKRMEAVGLLATMFAHEVGNPLNNMFIHAQMLQRKVERLELEEVLGSSIDLIMDELRRLIELLHEFRELYSRAPKSHGPVSVVVLLREIVRTQMAETASRLEVIEDIEPGLPPALGNVDKLKQVFINLCKNAVEAMPDGGQLTVRARARDRHIIVEIADTGVGMSADIDPFEAFHTTKSRGSGLGLAVVQQIVSDHEGTVTFTSERGRGTTFEVVLRVAESR